MKVSKFIFIILFSLSHIQAQYIAPPSVTGIKDGQRINIKDINPNDISFEQIKKTVFEYDENIKKSHLSEGIIFQATWSKNNSNHPVKYGTGGDSAIFSGFYMASLVYKYQVTKDESVLDDLLIATRGMHILSHITGVPGVIVKTAIREDQKEKFFYPKSWQHRIDKGAVHSFKMSSKDILNPSKFYPPMIAYTKATRDQLTGIILGLSTNWNILKGKHPKIQKIKDITKIITKAIYKRLKKKKFVIKDHNDQHFTSARRVNGILKLQLISLMRRIAHDSDEINGEFSEIENEFEKSFKKSLDLEDMEI